jgi:hypothetical protein
VVFEDNKSMIEHATDFYKKLFGEEAKSSIKLDEGFWEEEENVTSKENELLEGNLLEEEIPIAIKGSYAEGVPGPDGLSFLFYQKFWNIIKRDLMALVRRFERGELNIARLNYAMIILIPEEEEAKTLKKFRHISLINCSFKIFAKTLNNRLERISDRLLASNHTTFVKGMYILESVVAAREIIHHATKRKEKRLVLKLDYEKVYDRVSSYFRPGKCLRQGDPLSPLIFDLMLDVFTRILIKDVRKGYIIDFMDSLYHEGVISL